ncbi:MAG TPA: ATP-binding cassette domain-containing protein [Conexibacter sp.]
MLLVGSLTLAACGSNDEVGGSAATASTDGLGHGSAVARRDHREEERMSNEVGGAERLEAARPAPFLETRDLSKRYDHVVALEAVDATVREGEVVAVVGDNGAGKSTFISMLSGLNQPDAGEILIDGQQVTLDSPSAAHRVGIATVFQDLALINELDVAANLFLGQERRRLGMLADRRRMLDESSALISRLRVGLPSVRALASELSGGQRQAVAVARAVLRGSRLLLMDEPTAALGIRESRRVLNLIRELREEGHAVIVISHNIADVFELADRAMVFRLGRKVADLSIRETTRDHVVGLIVGADDQAGAHA